MYLDLIREMAFVFIITSIVGILLTLQVRLNFVEYKGATAILILVRTKHLINLMSIVRISSVVRFNW